LTKGLVIISRNQKLQSLKDGTNNEPYYQKKSSNNNKFSSAKNNIKQMKVSRILRDEISDIICTGDVKAVVYPDENLLKCVTIVDIALSADLSSAKVYISVLGNSVEKRQIYVWLNNNIGQVRHSLTKRLRTLRKVPEISFVLADTQGSFYLNEVIDEISTPSETASKSVNFEDVDFEEMDDEDE
jgi:ribosome-binding factor A